MATGLELEVGKRLIDNVFKQNSRDNAMKILTEDKLFERLSEVIGGIISWADSNEGIEYWETIYNQRVLLEQAKNLITKK